MTDTRIKVPFFSGKYYKELLKELRTIAIIFAAVQLFYGFLAGAFGAGGTIGITVFSGTSNSGAHSTIYVIYFIVAAFNFYLGHIARNSWDFRLSLPIAKRTMIVCHLAATLTYAAVIFVANYAGVLIAELVRLIPGAAGNLPHGLGMQAVSLIRDLLKGVIYYGGLIILACTIGRIMSLIIAALCAVMLPRLFGVFVDAIREGGGNTVSILLPIGIKGMQVFEWALLIFGAVVFAVLACVAYANHRTETTGKPARTTWIHVLLGLAFASCAGLFTGIICAAVYWSTYDPAIGGGSIVVPVVVTVVVMLIAYFAYMWISSRSFKNAAKRLAFLPLAAAFILLAFPIAKLVDTKWKNVDFSAENIDYVRVTDAALGSSNSVSSSIYGLSLTRGSTGAFSVKHTDKKIIDLVSQGAIDYISGNNKSELSFILKLIAPTVRVDGSDLVEVTLKNGGKWAIPSATLNSMALKNAAFNNDEYLKKATDVSRFKGGKVISPDWLGRDFTKTLIAELEKLTPEEREIVLYGENAPTDEFMGILSGYIAQYVSGSASYGRVLLASRTYDNSIYIEINDKLPETKKLYMQKQNEHNARQKEAKECLERLKSGDYEEVQGEVTFLEKDVKNIEEYFLGNNTDGAYPAKKREALKRIAELIENNRSIDNAAHIVKIDLGVISLSNNNRYGYWPSAIFVGLNDSEYEELRSLMANNFEKHFVEIPEIFPSDDV